MKNLLLLALVIGVGFWFWNENNKKEEKARADAAAALEAKRVASATPPPASVTTGNNLVWDPVVGRYVEKKSGPNRSGGGPAATPKRGTMLDQPARR